MPTLKQSNTSRFYEIKNLLENTELAPADYVRLSMEYHRLKTCAPRREWALKQFRRKPKTKGETQ